MAGSSGMSETDRAGQGMFGGMVDARALRMLDVYDQGHREEGEDGRQLRQPEAEGDR